MTGGFSRGTSELLAVAGERKNPAVDERGILRRQHLVTELRFSGHSFFLCSTTVPQVGC